MTEPTPKLANPFPIPPLPVYEHACGCIYLASPQFKLYDCSDETWGFWYLPASSREPSNLTPAAPDTVTAALEHLKTMHAESCMFQTLRSALQVLL